jgi:hypothetical protein
MNHTKLLRPLAGLALAALLVAACADPEGDPGSGAGSGQAASTTTAVPTTRSDVAPATEPTPPAGEVTVTGTVAAGVEPNCWLLEADGGPYLLVGGDRSQLRPGARLVVTGRVDRDLLSTCQQGEPLKVASIRAAP